MAVAQLAQAGEEAVGRDDDAAVALDRLDDDGRGGAEPGRRVLEGVADQREGAVAGVSRRRRAASDTGTGRAGSGRPARSRRVAGSGLAVEPDDAAAATEVAAGERDDLAAAGQRAGELDGRVVGVRAAEAEQDAVQTGRGDVEERLLERDARPRWPSRTRRGWRGRPGRGRRRRPRGGCGRSSRPRSCRRGRRTGCRRDRCRMEPCADSTTSGGRRPPVRGPAPSTARIRSMTARARGPG